MRKKAANKKRAEYPAETNGTRWAGAARRMAGKLTPEQEATHFARAMVKIYGGRPKEITGTGR
jgi:hypothetical protein